MQCLECGFDFDEVNESQPVCPRCGADPNNLPSSALGITPKEIKEATRPDSVITPGNDLIH